ncbi:mannose-6-phosphate isomerase [Brevibacillus sp. SYP-B805]|uniref:cysteine dioxygenase n=1 Tax=Brevibacillus sp. SYP-B805 TaxID=1578199 RepID=UPI0013EB2583|nr:cysteine dioxygenase family protein [Brevibacillus sp. SYP-B805]NGQ97413.1 mannose-6-phosphate isomerase [Brevibacillus sp. SYP-B805]
MDVRRKIEAAFQDMVQPAKEALWNALQSLPFTITEIAPYVTEPETLPYGRNTVFRNEHVEVVVIHLPPFTQSPIHDHGGSAACERVVEGKLTHATYTLSSGSRPVLKKIELVHPGQHCSVDPQELHSIANHTDKRVVTINVYAPPLSLSNVCQTDGEAEDPAARSRTREHSNR